MGGMPRFALHGATAADVSIPAARGDPAAVVHPHIGSSFATYRTVAAMWHNSLDTAHATALATPGTESLPLPTGVSPIAALLVSVVIVLTISLLTLLWGRRLARRGSPAGKIMHLAAGESRLLIPATFCLFASAALGMLIPFFGGQFVQLVAQPQGLSQEELNFVTSAILIVSFLFSVTSMVRGALFNLAGERIICKLRKQVFQRLLAQEVAYFDELTSGALVSRLTNDTATLQAAASTNISMALRSAASLLLSVVVMFATSWKLTLAMLATVPLVSVLAAVVGRISRKVSKNYQEQTAEMGKFASETFGNLRTVLAFPHGQKLMTRKYAQAADATYGFGVQQSWIYGSWSGIVGFLFFVAFTVVLRFGASLVQQGDMKPGALIAFVLYTISLSGSVAMLGSVVPTFYTAIGATAKIFEIIDRQPKLQDGDLNPGSSCSGLVEFDEVTFSYPSRSDVQVLNCVSFVAHPNQVVALVGPSGSGKSSCVSLIQRLYDCRGGSVKVAGEDVRGLHRDYLRRHIAVVSQEPILFVMTARENILFGKEGASETDMIDSAKLANCHDFISEFPEGYDTPVGERGVQLSGGQKQRVAIARALMLNPAILLLDEATSALDSESERVVQQALNSLMERKQGRTFIVVAHRLSTVRSADCIVVLQQGRCAECGTHEELVAKGGVYKELVQRQLDGSAV